MIFCTVFLCVCIENKRNSNIFCGAPFHWLLLPCVHVYYQGGWGSVTQMSPPELAEKQEE